MRRSAITIFFKTNAAFQQWTDAEGILDYLAFAKGFIAACEERYGEEEVERVLDAAHALMGQGVHRSPRRRRLDLRAEERRERERRAHGEQVFNDIWRTVPGRSARARAVSGAEERRRLLGLPEENLLYFLEKTAPRLLGWQREILRIVRQIAQYFYPQRQTKVMNEGCATYTHFFILRRLHETGRISDGAFFEFLQSHTGVVMQPAFDDPRFAGINPYALGFAMMRDIERIVTSPTEEDRTFAPDIAGVRDVPGVLREVWSNYRDESFVSQFLSPAVIRSMGLFAILDDADAPELRVTAIHDEAGYREVRRALSRSYDVGVRDPQIQVVDVDLAGDRTLMLEHRAKDGVLLDADDAQRVLLRLADLWGYEVVLREVDAEEETVLGSHAARPRRPFGRPL